MPHFTSLEYKNIQSVGNHPIKIQLDRSQNTLIGGPNGSGKSTMLYAFAYGLYGKFPSGTKLADAINSVNKKNLLVTISFTERGEEYTVVRGEKPKKFEIYKNGDPLDQDANARDQQKLLELILGMDYKTFTQIVLLNKERYVPFMEMNAGDRRKIVEDILGISIFSEMNEVTKQRIKENQRLVANTERQIDLKQTELQGQQRLVTQIQDTLTAATKDNEAKIKQLREELAEYESNIDTLNDQLSQLSVDGHEKVKQQKREYEKLALQFDQKINTAKKNSGFFETNDHCPTCGQSIDEELKQQKKHECDQKVDEIQNVVAEMLVELESVVAKNKQFDDIEAERREINNQLNQESYQIKSLKRQINDLAQEKQSTTDTKQLDDAVAKYEEIEGEITDLRKQYEDQAEHGDLLESMRAVLKDDGVKAVIIREYMALMNRKINEYLQAMNFYINMTLDENFKESFGAMHKEKFTMSNLSTGQKMRVNIAIWLALLEVASIKNSVVSNVLLIDEIMEPLDTQGVESVMALFKDKLQDKNIFVVTQRRDEFSPLFYSEILFKQNEGFTEIQ